MRHFVVYSVLLVACLAGLVFSAGLLGHITAAVEQSNAWGDREALITWAVTWFAPLVTGFLTWDIVTELPYLWEIMQEDKREEQRRRRKRAVA